MALDQPDTFRVKAGWRSFLARGSALGIDQSRTGPKLECNCKKRRRSFLNLRGVPRIARPEIPVQSKWLSAYTARFSGYDLLLSSGL
jgi:hypothetical protein